MVGVVPGFVSAGAVTAMSDYELKHIRELALRAAHTGRTQFTRFMDPAALEDAPLTPCASCLQSLPPWEAFLFYGIYEGDLRESLLRGKFGGSLPALDMLGRLLAEVCAEHYAFAPKPQLIVPVPLHTSRLRERGFNQSLELARVVGRVLDLPVRYDLLVRVRPAVPQASLSREQRKKLVQPFAAGEGLHGRRVLLVDDVCTTGATLSCAARCLLEAGASQVDAAAVARTSLHSAHGAGAPRRE